MKTIKTISKSTPFSLVLSGGGALAYAHLGVLHDLQAANLNPSEVIGTSMGGVIGACIAIGMAESDITQMLHSYASLPQWFSLHWGSGALLDTAKIASLFQEIFGNRTMKQTNIPLTLIATDLQTGKRRLFTHADNIFLRDALLATIAIPGIFPPKEISGKLYVDGFLVENLGITVAQHGTILASDVFGQNSIKDKFNQHYTPQVSFAQTMEHSLRILLHNQTQAHLAYVQASILLIEPPTHNFHTFQFHKIDEIRSVGLGCYKANTEH